MARRLLFSPDQMREARLRRGWSQAQLAHALQTQEQKISRWERGINEPGANAVAAMAVALGQSIEFFYVEASADDDEKEAAMRRLQARALIDSVDPIVADALYAELQERHGSKSRDRERSRS